MFKISNQLSLIRVSTKTLLLRCRINPQSLEGQILANHKPLGSDFKRISGYVMQDDQLFPRLTVRETLMFSARLRLPGTMSQKEKQDRVEEMIQVLGLKSCAETRIGDDEVRAFEEILKSRGLGLFSVAKVVGILGLKSCAETRIGNDEVRVFESMGLSRG